jgi:hypothetical protein
MEKQDRIIENKDNQYGKLVQRMNGFDTDIFVKQFLYLHFFHNHWSSQQCNLCKQTWDNCSVMLYRARD